MKKTAMIFTALMLWQVVAGAQGAGRKISLVVNETFSSQLRPEQDQPTSQRASRRSLVSSSACWAAQFFQNDT